MKEYLLFSQNLVVLLPDYKLFLLDPCGNISPPSICPYPQLHSSVSQLVLKCNLFSAAQQITFAHKHRTWDFQRFTPKLRRTSLGMQHLSANPSSFSLFNIYMGREEITLQLHSVLENCNKGSIQVFVDFVKHLCQPQQYLFFLSTYLKGLLFVQGYNMLRQNLQLTDLFAV